MAFVKILLPASVVSVIRDTNLLQTERNVKVTTIVLATICSYRSKLLLSVCSLTRSF